MLVEHFVYRPQTLRGSPAMTKFGIYVNNRAAVFLGDGFGITDLVELAVASDEAGIDFVSVGDSVLAKPRWSPIVTLASIATRTQRVELSTGIIQPHLRNPVLLAQEWATLDAVSGGRTSIGVGLGTGPREGVEAEYRLVGLPISRRGLAFEDAIILLKRLWTEDAVTYHGKVLSVDDVSIGLRPVRRPHPPILIAAAGFTPKVAGHGPNDVYRPEEAGTFGGRTDRVARLGDGWITGMARPDEVRAGVQTIRAQAEAIGRVLPDDFDVRLNCFIRVDDDLAEARAAGTAFLEAYHRRPFDDDSIDRWLIHGPAEVCAAQIAAYVDAGVTSFQFVLADDHQRRQLDRVVGVLDPVRR
jgi:alkanesulfonate monooxygenase SsuD/methylene tetrahydromethanopterin reductase-like flavin-dependent oxidoreductase (luciferase family)